MITSPILWMRKWELKSLNNWLIPASKFQKKYWALFPECISSLKPSTDVGWGPNVAQIITNRKIRRIQLSVPRSFCFLSDLSSWFLTASHNHVAQHSWNWGHKILSFGFRKHQPVVQAQLEFQADSISQRVHFLRSPDLQDQPPPWSCQDDDAAHTRC